MTPSDNDYQQCHYCDEWYFIPVSYHHTEAECAKNQKRQPEENA